MGGRVRAARVIGGGEASTAGYVRAGRAVGVPVRFRFKVGGGAGGIGSIAGERALCAFPPCGPVDRAEAGEEFAPGAVAVSAVREPVVPQVRVIGVRRR